MAKTAKEESLIVHLRVYKGSKLSFDANGKSQNENQSVKMEYGTRQYENFLKFINQNGYAAVKVEKVLEGKEFSPLAKDHDDFKKVAAEVAEAFGAKDEKETTEDPRDKQIAELKELLKAAKEGKKEAKNEGPTGNEEEVLAKAKERYKELYGNPPHHKWDINKIHKLIEEKELE